MSYYIRDGVDLKEVPLHKVETLMNAGITIISDKDIIKELKQQLEEKDRMLNHLGKKNEEHVKAWEEAVEVIEFYGDTANWDSKEGLNDTYIDGVITYSDIYSPWDEVGISVGGKRASLFLAKYREEK